MLGLEVSTCSASCVIPRELTDPLKGSPPPPFIDAKRDGYMHRGSRKSSSLPELWGYNSRVLWEAHSRVWRRAWRSSWSSSLTSRRSRRRPANPSRRRGRRCRVYSSPDVAFCGAPWALQVRALHIHVHQRWQGHVAIPDPPGRSASVCTKEVRESHGDPGPLEGGGPGFRLLAPGVPLRGARGDAGPLPKQEAGPRPYVW